MRKHGLACDNLVAADVVTADGRLVHASEAENADLLWGLRGGGGNFGIVTQFELELHPVGPMVYAGPIFYPADAARDLLRTFRDWAADAPDEITALVDLTTAPPLPVIPEEWHGKKVAAFIAVSAGPLDDGEPSVAGIPRGRRADRRPARPDAVPRDPDAHRSPVGKGNQLRTSRRRTCPGSTTTLVDRLCELHLAAPGRSARSTCTKWAEPSAASATTPRRSPSVRCRSCSTPSRAGTIRTGRPVAHASGRAT